MDAKKVVISCGPIPARLDSVKFITNRFKGGLAFRTAQYLIDKGLDVTIVMWKHTKLPKVDGCYSEYWMQENVHVITVEDVFAYYNWFAENAGQYNAFVMAAAVANLAPSEPLAGKFPSHNYKVGDKFNIQFEIAPRAIDVVKKVNPRACLIGYKLFDAKSDEELIDIARHTLSDAKANIIFANTPGEAKSKKIAVLPDNSVIPCDFEEHLELIYRAIKQEYYRTVIEPLTEEEMHMIRLREATSIVKMYEKTFHGFGTVGAPILASGRTWFATTSRGHQGEPVIVKRVDHIQRIVYATGKATLNAPTLDRILAQRNYSGIVVHRHDDDPNFQPGPAQDFFHEYLFPGSKDEASAVELAFFYGKSLQRVKLPYHGDLTFIPKQMVDWTKYYEEFPARYFSIPDQMQSLIDHYNQGETLEMGANRQACCKYAYDPFVQAENAVNVDIQYVLTHEFDFVVVKNAINYLDKNTIRRVVQRTKHFVANTFLSSPEEKVTENEAAVKVDMNGGALVLHALRLKNDGLVQHEFYAYEQSDYEELGLKVFPYGRNSALLVKADDSDLNTRVSYLYRDASNYKRQNTAIVRGVLSKQEQRAILDSLNEEKYFIPHQVGLPEKRFSTWSEQDDHCWFELAPDFAEICYDTPTVNLDCAQLTANFIAAKDNWDGSIVD